MEDNFYRASTERLIKAPKRQTEKDLRDKLAFEKERPLVTAVIKRLETEISRREKIDSIQNITDPALFMQEVAVNKQVCIILRSELNHLKTKVRMYDNGKLK